MFVIGRFSMKKYLLIIVLLVSSGIVVPFMPIGTVNKIIAEAAVIGVLFIIYNAIQKESQDK
jgi:hypothetical protein